MVINLISPFPGGLNKGFLPQHGIFIFLQNKGLMWENAVTGHGRICGRLILKLMLECIVSVLFTIPKSKLIILL